MIRIPQASDIRVEVFFDFLGEFLDQEEVILPPGRGCLTAIICLPEKHPLPQEYEFLGPVLPDYLRT
jgi:hypothetical protein